MKTLSIIYFATSFMLLGIADNSPVWLIFAVAINFAMSCLLLNKMSKNLTKDTKNQ